MKKLLTLFLVLGLSSLASALTINLSLNGTSAMGTTMDVLQDDLGEGISLGIISDTSGEGYYTYLRMIDNNKATYTNVAITTKAGDMGSVGDYSTATPGYITWLMTAAGSPSGLPQAGKQFTFDLTPSTSLDYGDTFDFWITVPGDDNLTATHTVTVKVVPEPITILLLGIGGLFLRRR